jgi:sensor histidine kinase YesM
LSELKKYKVVFYSVIALFFLMQIAQAQTPLNNLLVRRFTTSNGLLSNQIYSIYQDRKGLMWFGGKGLQSFDGYRFKTYLPFESPQLISFIIDDVDGNIYFGKGADLAYPTAIYKLDVNTGKYQIFQDSIIISGKKQKLLFAHTPIKAKDGTLWFALYPNAYAVLRPHSKELKVISDDWHLKNVIHYRQSFEILNNAFIWQSTPEDGVYRIDVKNESITNAKNNYKNEKIFNTKLPPLLTFSADMDSNFWMIKSNNEFEIIRLDYKKMIPKIYKFPTPNFKTFDMMHQIKTDKKGNVWFTPSGHSGLARYNKLLDTLDYMFVNTSTENKLRHQYSFGAAGMNIFIDKENNVWYPGDGVQFFNPNGQQIISYTYNNILNDIKNVPLDKEKMNSGMAIDIIQMGNKDIYISYCTGGLIKLDSNGNHPENIALPIQYDCLRKMFSPDGVLLYFKNSYNKEMYVYHTKNKSIKQVNNEYLNTAIISKFYRDNDSTIFIGDPNIGITKYNPISNKISKLPLLHFPENKEWLTRSMLAEGNENLWVSLGFCGVYLINKRTGFTVDSIIPDPKNFNEKVDANAVMHIARWNADSILLCTLEGLIIYNTKTKISKKLTIADGLIDNCLAYCIADTNSKQIWINSIYKGLCKYNMLSKRTITPVPEEGNYLSEGIKIGLKTSNDDLLFLFSNGISFIKKDKKFNNYKPSNVVITDVIINNISILNNQLFDSAKILSLTPIENNITINFSCLDFWSNQSIIYYTYLEGLDTNFIKLKGAPELVYKGLAAGSYTLHIKSAYQNGNYCNAETIFRFKINPIFYKTWWFIFLLLGFITYGIYYFLKKRNQSTLDVANLKNEQLQNKLALEEQRKEVEKINAQLVEVQLSALRSQMNPHFIFNSLNSINSVVIENNIPLASDYLTKFSKLIRLILENSKSNLIPLSKELEALKLYLLMEGIRFKDKFDYTIIIEEYLNTESINIPPTTLQPFVENAIVHGVMHLNQKGHITINIKNSTEHLLEIIIDDNGVGRTKAAELKSRTNVHKSHGYQITKERIMQLHPQNDIRILDKVNDELQAIGTSIIITLHY